MLGEYVGDKGDAYEPELIVRVLDMDRIKEVRDGWAFHRDRRPDAYGELVEGMKMTTTLIPGRHGDLRRRASRRPTC